MHAKLVIDAIVRQTTVLIAQVATSAGMRAPLAQIANQTFLSLTRELERQGIAQKVIADMFGLALRSYQQKVQRISESATDQGRTLWEAVHDYVSQRQVASRSDVLLRFARDDQATVRGILSDMVDTGVVYRTGRGDGTIYRVAPAEEIERVSSRDALESAAALLWVSIYRDGPLDLAQLGERVAISEDAIQTALASLCADGRVREEQLGDRMVYRSESCLIPFGVSAGWEAALLDHYQALVRSICAKLERGAGAARDDRIGGSTYSFDVWPGHPLHERVSSLLAEQRTSLSALWNEVGAYNEEHPRTAVRERVTFYFGQLVTSENDELAASGEAND
jgi:hypothetical protein